MTKPIERTVVVPHDELLRMVRRVIADQVGIDIDDSGLAWSLRLMADHVPGPGDKPAAVMSLMIGAPAAVAPTKAKRAKA